MPRIKKEKKPVELYWQEFITAYFEFTKSKFSITPSFNGSAPRDLKAIVQALRKRTEEAGVEWTQETALQTFNTFLKWAFSDWWLSENWMLSNINRQMDKVLFKAAKHKNNEMQ